MWLSLWFFSFFRSILSLHPPNKMWLSLLGPLCCLFLSLPVVCFFFEAARPGGSTSRGCVAASVTQTSEQPTVSQKNRGPLPPPSQWFVVVVVVGVECACRIVPDSPFLPPPPQWLQLSLEKSTAKKRLAQAIPWRPASWNTGARLPSEREGAHLKGGLSLQETWGEPCFAAELSMWLLAERAYRGIIWRTHIYGRGPSPHPSRSMPMFYRGICRRLAKTQGVQDAHNFLIKDPPPKIPALVVQTSCGLSWP